MSQRENRLAIGVIGAVVFALLWYVVLTPYLTALGDVDKDQADVVKQQNDADQLFARQRHLTKIWKELENGGLNVDPSQAESQTLHALNEWTQGAGVHLDSLKSERATQAGSFQVIGFSVQGTGSLPQVARLLWALETATIPVRINEMQITPRKEGTDDLQVRVTVTALCQPPKQPGSSAGGAL